MINKINDWIDQTLLDHSLDNESCDRLQTHFRGFYPAEFLSATRFVIVDVIPKPDFPELRTMGLANFIDMDASAITYKNVYFIKRQNVGNLSTHFHELVHVLQWYYLGAEGFIRRYIDEIQTFGYHQAPLELMAYALSDHYANKKGAFDVASYVKDNLG